MSGSAAAGKLAYEVRGLTRRYGRGAAQVLANVDLDLEVPAGSVLGLIGANGAGKTTLVRQLVGLMRPDAGSVRLFGTDLAAHPDRAARLVAYLPQHEAALADLPVAPAVRSTGQLRGLTAREAAAEANAVLAELGLEPLASRVIGRLSGGQRRLAAVAATLVGRRPVLVLDEPTAGLDPLARQMFWQALEQRRRSGVTVVLVTHHLMEAEGIFDQVAVLRAGRLVAHDTPGRLKAALSSDVRLDLVWRTAPPLADPAVAELAARLGESADDPASSISRRWQLRLPLSEARLMLGRLTSGPALAALDDFTLSTSSLEDVYLGADSFAPPAEDSAGEDTALAGGRPR